MLTVKIIKRPLQLKAPNVHAQPVAAHIIRVPLLAVIPMRRERYSSPLYKAIVSTL